MFRPLCRWGRSSLGGFALPGIGGRFPVSRFPFPAFPPRFAFPVAAGLSNRVRTIHSQETGSSGSSIKPSFPFKNATVIFSVVASVLAFQALKKETTQSQPSTDLFGTRLDLLVGILFAQIRGDSQAAKSLADIANSRSSWGETAEQLKGLIAILGLRVEDELTPRQIKDLSSRLERAMREDIFGDKLPDIKDFFDFYYVLSLLFSPVALSGNKYLDAAGYKDHNGFFTEISTEQDKRLQKFNEVYLSILMKYVGKLTEENDKLNWSILKLELEKNLAMSKFPYKHQFNQYWGVHTSVRYTLTNLTPIKSYDDALNYLLRLRGIQEHFNEALKYSINQQRMGVNPPPCIFVKVSDQLREFCEQKPTANIFYTTLKDALDKLQLSNEQKTALLREAEEVIQLNIYPTYRKTSQQLCEIASNFTDDDGVWKFPKGRKYYQLCIQKETTTDMIPRAIYNAGVAEVDRIKREVHKLLQTTELQKEIETLGLNNKPFGEILAGIGKSKEHFYSNDEAGRKQCLEDCTKLLESLSKTFDPFFTQKPKTPCEIAAIPTEEQDGAPAAYYHPPSEDGTRPGKVSINLKDMALLPKWKLPILLAHEGIPGHHFHLALVQEQGDVPAFRKSSKGNNGHIEGWGVYCEQLGYELGVYKTPLEKIGYYQYALLRAARMVADVGIHEEMWSKEEAAKYLRETTGLPEKQIEAEVLRYIGFAPAQACSYGVGKLAILKMRQDVQEKLGGKFDYRKFHDLLLDGTLPLTILQQRVDDYIKSVQ